MSEPNRVSRPRFIPPMLLCAALLFGGYCPAETLGDVLRSLELPNPPLSIADVGQPISSYGVLNEPAQFVIAYYRDDGSSQLQPPLFLLRYLKPEQRWNKGNLSQISASTSGIKVDCFGSAMQIYRAGHYLFVDTHLNPSAGCTLVLRENLTLKTALYGWFLGAFSDGTVLFHNREVHFASTHPMEISLYDPSRSREVKIYPPANDQERKRYTDELDKAVPDQKWCREFNSHCDTTRFSNDLSDGPAINDRTRSFSFIAKYEADGYGPKMHGAVRSKDVIYIYKILPTGMVHREIPFEKAEHLFGTTSLQEFLTPEMLARIFGTQP